MRAVSSLSCLFLLVWAGTISMCQALLVCLLGVLREKEGCSAVDSRGPSIGRALSSRQI